MSMSTLETDLWKQILREKHYDFTSLGSEDPLLLVKDRESFRKYFEASCKRIKYKRTTKALGRLWNSFDHMRSFIKVLKGATLDQGDKSYICFIWGACFAVIQCVCANGFTPTSSVEALEGPDGLVNLVADLNNSLPDFSEDLESDDELSAQGQEALREIYSNYMDCCLSIISLITGRDLSSYPRWSSKLSSTREYVDHTAKEFIIAKAKFDKVISLLSASGGVAVLRPRVQSSHETSRRSLQAQHIPGSYPSSTSYYQVFERYRLDRNLGHGAFGIVSQVTDVSTGKVYARKQIELPKGQDWVKFRNSILHEVNNMRSVACAHTVNVEEYQEVEKHAMQIYMTPVADGDLGTVLELWVKGKSPNLKAETIYSWFGCLFQALEFVHSKDVVHKDIKPSNILIKDQTIYLADFGLSRSFEGGSSWTHGEFAGTPEYQAPEYITGQKHGRSVDIFALGCVFSEILTTLRKRELEEFKERRFVLEVPEIQLRVYSFHRKIMPVEEWVRDLGGDEIDHFLIETILGMLKFDVDERKMLAKQALTSLEGWMKLRCDHGC